MLAQVKRVCLLMFALPAAAFAAPVTVVTHSTGTISVNPTVLEALGARHLEGAQQLPYELTLTSVYDWEGPLPGRTEPAFTSPTSVAVDFRLGGFDYGYAGAGSSTVFLSGSDGAPGYYTQLVGFFPATPVPRSQFYFENQLGPMETVGWSGALAPGRASDDNSDGSFIGAVRVEFSQPRWNGGYDSYRMQGAIASYAVQVTSPVPEPAAYAMLAAGLLALTMRRRQGWKT